MAGILAFGAYVPRLRLQRESIVAANGWFNPALAGQAKGERAICNWDEDALTMAVEAARDCLAGRDRSDVGAVVLASTTLPFEDRQNAVVLAEALNLDEDISAIDVTSSQRAGTSALIAALERQAGGARPTLLVTSEHRVGKAGSAQELTGGDGAAALLLGEGEGVAELLSAHQVSLDFVDHYRGRNQVFDYGWEERWVRDEGYLKIIPRAVAAALEGAGLEGRDVDHLIVPVGGARVAKRVAATAGIDPAAVRDDLSGVLGQTGAAHPIVMLAAALEGARPGQTVLVVGFGQGCDAVLLRTTAALEALPAGGGLRGALAAGRKETNYQRYLSFRQLVEQERGIRSELDKQTALSALYRNRKMILGFVGGRCTVCGTVQFPKSAVCVSPNCGRFHTQEDHPLADAAASIQSWTADNLTYSVSPPHHFGMVVFEDGGRLMADITDVGAGEVDVGMPVRMVFRIKDVDERRGFRRYFWKAAPAAGEAPAKP